MNVLINKITFVFLIMVTFSFISHANQLSDQDLVNDSVYVEIIGDTVKIWDKQIYENCCSKFIHDISLYKNTITVIEKDTSINYCRCMCYYDLSATILNLKFGYYNVAVYRSYAIENYDSLYFIDTTSFVYERIGTIEPTIISSQSKCYTPSFIREIIEIPKEFKLEQNYPNPFNPSTIISYQLPTASWVALKVYNMLGQEVMTLVDEMQDAGYKSLVWDASTSSRLPSGIYLYRIYADKFIETKELLLIK